MKRFYLSKLVILIAILSGWNINAFAQTSTFNWNGTGGVGSAGTVQTYTVPTGVTLLGIDMEGACGGGYYNGTGTAGPVALAGRVQCNITVSSGEVLYIYVGGMGQNMSTGGTVVGGWNGGQNSTSSWAAGSGGCTDIRTCNGCTPNATNRLVVAGGGGGGGDWNSYGGVGGGLTGGSPGPNSNDGGAVATGGTQLSGGTGTTGNAGTYGVGGAPEAGFSEAGGGGGYWGGHSGSNLGVSYSGIGGGGGSSYTDPVLAAAVTHTQGYSGANGNGRVIITVLCNGAGSITGTFSACMGATTTLTAVAASGGTWSSGNASVATIGATGVVTGVSPGTAVITYNVPNPCGGIIPATATVTINQTPSAIIGTTAICNFTSTNLSSGPSGGTWTSSNTANATVGSGSGTVYGMAAGTTGITYTLSGGCNVATAVTVNAGPVAISASSVVICAGQETALTDASTGGVWSTSLSGIATVSAAGLVTGVNGGSTLISYTFASTGCLSTAQVTVNPLPTHFSVTQTGGASYCAGSPSPIQIGLSGSAVGVNYQLYNGISPVGVPIPGTGSPLSFGFPTGTGSFTVLGTYAATSCSVNMTGSGSITTTPAPSVFTVSGNASFCAGASASVHILLSNSTSGFEYRLYNGTALIDSLTGTGTALDFGSMSVAGIYTVVAINPTTGCTSNMAGTAVLTINPLPNVYTVTGGGAYCQGTPGEHIGLSFSNAGIHYSLFNDGVFVESVTGSGSSLDFGFMTSTGAYTVVANNPATGCTSNMSGSTVITVNYPPASFNVTGGGNYCLGGIGVSIGLDGSETTAFYQAIDGTIPEGGPLTGIGTAFNLGSSFVSTGTYIVVATSIISGCKDTMTGSVTVGTNPVPAIYSVSGGGGYCDGGAGVPVLLSNSDYGINYRLYYGTTYTGDSVVGFESPINFGNVTTGGTYRVVAVDAVTGCESNMSGTVTVVVDPLPDVYNVTGTGAYCASDAGRDVGLSFSNTGITYEFFNDGSFIDSVLGSGAAIDFGVQEGPASYTVVAVNTTTRCSSNMSGSADITANPSPYPYNVTGGGDYCSGTGGVHIGIDGSDAGDSYQVYKGAIPIGSAVTGTGGSSIDFGVFSGAGTYTVVGTSAGCSTTMNGNAVVSIDPPPAAFVLSGGGNICASGSGADFTLSGSAIGVNYQLYNAGTTVGAAVAGTGGSLNFGFQTGSGVYTVVATDGIGCTANMTGTPNIHILPAPSLHTVTGGGSYCSGGSGKVIGLDGSDAAIHYQLSFGGFPVGPVVTGTGFAINFGSYTVGGNYTVVAFNPVNGCSATMAGSATITINGLPALETVSGGGAYCIGGTGSDVSLSSSESGDSYQLFIGGVSTGLPPVTGTGDPLDFGSQTLAGTYTVVSTNPSGCSTAMTGNAVVTISAPAVYTVSGSATFCQGSTTSHIALSGSQTGVNYQLNNGAAPAGVPVAGTGLALDFGVPPASGAYNVIATNSSSGCTISMAGSAAIVINPSPALHTVTGGGPYCSSDTGVHIGLNGSDAGMSYLLYNGSIASGSSLSGSGSALDFGLVTAAGSYKVIATNSGTSCTAIMSDTVAVTIKPSPVAYALSAANLGNYCAPPAPADTGVHISLSGSTIGISYKLYRYATLLTTTTGTGGVLDFGLQTIAGPYSVIATDPLAGCDNNMTGSPVVNIIALPVAHNVSGGGGYCPGGIGQDVLLDGSNAGMYYQLYNSGTPVGDSIYGTGIPLDFGYQLAGTYTVIGTDKVTMSGITVTCPNPMTGSAIVSLDTLLLPSVTVHAYPAGSGVSHIDSVKAIVTNGGPDPSYQWAINGNIIPGATQATYAALQFFNGDSLSCIVTSSGPCGGRSSSGYVIISISRVGVAQVNSAGNDIKLMPNPNKGIFNLKGTLGSTTDEELSVEISNMLGQVVYTNKIVVQNGNVDERIELSQTLSNGMYIMTLRSGAQSNVIHFVIEQ